MWERKMKRFNKIDFFCGMLWIFLTAICFLLFEFDYDNACLIYCGNIILEGHLADFYETVESVYGSMGFYPILYPLIFAVWNLPVKLLTGKLYTNPTDIPVSIFFWNKILIILCYVSIAFLLKDIIRRIKGEEASGYYKLWFLMPLAYFSAIIMGMYDVWYVLIMVLSLKYYFSDWKQNKKDKYLFILLFGVSICLKTLPVFYFVPLLLIKEKRILSLIKDGVIFAIPYVICCIPFLHSDAFIRNVLMFSGKASPMLLQSAVGINYIVIVSLILIYIYCYFCVSQENYTSQSILMCNLVSAFLWGFGSFHPHWLIIITPFVVLALTDVYKENLYQYFWVLALTGIAYFVIFALQHGNVFLTAGILGDLVHNKTSVTLAEFYHISDIKIANSVFCAGLLGFCFLTALRKNSSSDPSKNDNALFVTINGRYVKTWLYPTLIFTATMLFYVIPACLCNLGFFPDIVFDNETKYSQEYSRGLTLNQGQSASMTFEISKTTSLDKLEILAFTWNNEYGDASLYLHLLDADGAEIVCVSHPLSDFVDGQVSTIDLNATVLAQGIYSIVFDTDAIDSQFGISALLKEGLGKEVIYNNEIFTDAEIQMDIMGKEMG